MKKGNKNRKVTSHINIFSSFEQYGLSKPNIMRFDVSKNGFKHKRMFDAIICDPPYGLRAGVKQTGLKNENELEKMMANIEIAREQQ